MITSSFDDQYPYIAAWVQSGVIEIGNNEYDDGFLRVIDAGGVIWESNQSYDCLDDAFADMNSGIGSWCEENGIDLGIE